jgi:hypothetical protein
MENSLYDLDFKIVIGRYSEDISWCSPFAPKISIQNHGTSNNIPLELLNYTTQATNVGSEAHCYLNFVVENYDNLPEIIIFAQAGISDHHDIFEPNFSKSPFKQVDSIHPYATKLSSKDILIEMIKQVHFFGHTLNARVYHSGSMFHTTDHKFAGNNLHVEDITFGSWFKSNVSSEFPHPTELLWFKNAIFGVSKAHILSRPKDYYVQLRDAFKHVKSNIEHYFERAWYYVFNIHKVIIPHSLQNVLLQNSHIFDKLDDNYFFKGRYNDDNSDYDETSVHKQANMLHLAKDAKQILSLGFDKGHIVSLMMIANSESVLAVHEKRMNLKNSENFTFVQSTYGTSRFIDLHNYKVVVDKFDLVHISPEYANTDIVTNLLKKCCDDSSILVFDDYNTDDVHNFVDLLLKDNIIAPYTGLLYQHCGEMHHYVCHLNFQIE